MGNTCNGRSTSQPYQVTSLPLRKQQSTMCMKRITVSQRFRGEVEKLKMDGQNMYKLILTVQGERQQSRTVEMKFMFSYADMQITPQYKFTLEDMTHFPIIDQLQHMMNNPQIYHKIRTIEKRKKSMKYYNFRTLNDYQFKKGLYEISLYKRLQHNTMLQDYFVIYKGEMKQLVMIFNYSYATLHDMLYYRKLAAYQWEEVELLMLMHMLCESLLELKRVNIVHRDIRPGKVFFTPLVHVGNPPELITSGGNNSGSSGRFYNLMNLQSARVYERGYGVVEGENVMKDYGVDTDLLTVKGVPTYTDPPVRQALQRDEHKANYNPQQSDIHSLKHTLKSLITLQPNNTLSLDQNLLKSKPKISQLLKYICSPQITIQQLNDKVLQLMGILTFIKPTFYFAMMRDFYMKELTIAQNIQMNLYFNSSCGDGGSGEISNISQGLAKNSSMEQVNHNNSPLTGKQFAEDLYIKALYDLHKKDTFVPLMLQKLSKNFSLNKKQENVSLLIKVGRYFQQAGIKQNQYYKQAIMLLLQLAQEERLQGFYKDHQRLVMSAEEMFNKFSADSKMIIRAKCTLLKEKAYKELFLSSSKNPTNSNNQSPSILLYNMRNSSNIQQLNNPNLLVQGMINQAYELAMRSNLPFEEQLELIYSKGELCLLMGKVQEGEMMYLRGYQLSEKNYKQFMTVHNCTKYKAIFQYGLGMVDLLRLRTRSVQKSPKLIFSLQTKLSTSKQRLTSITIHPIYIIRCYIALGDLLLLKQSPQQALNSYQKALNLLQAENSQSEERRVSSEIELNIVERILDVCGSNVNGIMSGDVQRYEGLYEGLKREVNKQRKLQKKYSRKGKLTTSNSMKSNPTNSSTNNRPQPLYQQHPPLLPVIRQQQQQQHKMFESQIKLIEDNNRLVQRGSYGYGQQSQQQRQPQMRYKSKQRQSPINISLGYLDEHEYEGQQNSGGFA